MGVKPRIEVALKRERLAIPIHLYTCMTKTRKEMPSNSGIGLWCALLPNSWPCAVIVCNTDIGITHIFEEEKKNKK